MQQKDIIRIAVIGTWQDVVEAQRKVKKFAAAGLYLDVMQLSNEEVKGGVVDFPIYASWFKNQFTPRLVAARKRTLDIEHFVITVRGPKVTTPKPSRFFIVQQNEDGSFTPSVPMSEGRARETLKSGRGVISHLCEVKETFDGRRPG
jgi:hypothetical protein